MCWRPQICRYSEICTMVHNYTIITSKFSPWYKSHPHCLPNPVQFPDLATVNLLRRKSAVSSITARQAAPGIVKLRQLRNILLWRQLPPEIHLTENTPGGNPRPSCTTGLFKDQFRTAQSSNSMASTEREPITGVWGRSPQRGSRRQSPGWGVRGRMSKFTAHRPNAVVHPVRKIHPLTFDGNLL